MSDDTIELAARPCAARLREDEDASAPDAPVAPARPAVPDGEIREKPLESSGPACHSRGARMARRSTTKRTRKTSETRRSRKAPALRVAILYPESDPTLVRGRGDEPASLDWSIDTYGQFREALESLGWDPVDVGIGFATLSRLAELDCDVAINLCDGSTIDGEPGVEVIDALEARGIPYTGARRAAYWLGSDKVRMKVRFLNAGVPTPRFRVVVDPDELVAGPDGLRFPLFVKPRDSGGSTGVGLASRVDDPLELRERLTEIVGTYGPALVEEYVDGRELSVGVLGDIDGPHELVVLPPVEVRFGPAYPPERRVQTFQTKFDPTSPLYNGYELVCPAPLDAAETEAVVAAARAAYASIGGTGYGRVDMRLQDGEPYVLEVNPNCSLEWSSEPTGMCLFPFAAQTIGWTQADVYRKLVEVALARAPLAPTVAEADVARPDAATSTEPPRRRRSTGRTTRH